MSPLSDKCYRAMKNPARMKFLATICEDGKPNVVPVLSTTAWDRETIIFVRFMVWKTAKNLLERKKVAVCAFGFFSSVEVLGDFVCFERSGERLEYFNEQPLYRYNAYFGAGEVGVIRVKEEKGFIAGSGITKLILAKLSFQNVSNGVCNEVMHPLLKEKLQKTLSIKFLSWVDEENEPRLKPCPGLFVLSSNQVGVIGEKKLFRNFKEGKDIALCVFSTEPSAYQLKGKFSGFASKNGIDFALIELEESYSATPPLAGERIYP